MSMEGSNTTWDCGDTLPVIIIGIKANLIAWIGDMTKYIPGVLLSFYLSNGSSANRVLDNSYMGKKSGFQCCGLEATLYFLNICVVVDVQMIQR